MTELEKRLLGRTKRHVTTLGLGGQASIQWPASGVDPLPIIEKALHRGITYIDTSNIYGPSQKYFGEVFSRLGISPSAKNHAPNARARLFIATKTHIRTARRPEGEKYRSDFSEGMLDKSGVSTSVDDVRRSLSLLFGDGKGNYPEDAFLDSVQFHNINTMDEIDMLFTGMEDPSPEKPWMGSFAAMVDLREGTNRTGCNPKYEKLIRHIGITGHWNTAALIYAIQRDTHRLIDTLLVTINPADRLYMPHRHNAIAVAKAAEMGIIGMKVFADAAYYHKAPHFSSTPEDVYHEIGSTELPSRDLIRYALSVDGINTVITGIGHIDDNAEKCQLEQNLKAAQIEKPLDDDEMKKIEEMLAASGKSSANAYFQRKATGLTPPRNPGVEPDSSMPLLGRFAIRVSWDTAYAGAFPIERYDILRNGEIIGSVPHHPQYSLERFYFDDVFKGPQAESFSYAVKAVDIQGNESQTHALMADPSVDA